MGKIIASSKTDCEEETEPEDRFYLLDPEERKALRVLVTEYLNTISEISLHKDFRVTEYLDWLANLEEELVG